MFLWVDSLKDLCALPVLRKEWIIFNRGSGACLWKCLGRGSSAQGDVDEEMMIVSSVSQVAIKDSKAPLMWLCCLLRTVLSLSHSLSV